MRILHVISGLDPACGGPVTALCGMVRAQQRAGLDVQIFSPFDRANSLVLAQSLPQEGIPVTLVGPTVRAFRGWHRQMGPALRKLLGEVDVVHIHAMWEASQHIACREAARAGVPYVLTPHGMLDRWNMSNGWLKKQLYVRLRTRWHLQHARAIHFVTAQEQQWAIKLPYPALQIVEPFGVDFSEFDPLPQPGTFRQQFSQVGDRPFVLFLGRVDRGKGWETLIPAFAQVIRNQAFHHWLLVVAGPDYFGNLAKAKNLATHHGIADRVLFTGQLSGPQRLAALQDCALLALPSCHENFGIVVAEALAAGRPALVSDQVGLQDEIRTWNAGEVIPLEIGQTALALQRWMGSPQQCEAAGNRGRQMARAHFDWQTIAGRWLQHYQAIARK